MIDLYGPKFGFGLYVHWPYCSRICPYCDFNVYAAKTTRDTSSLVKSVVADIQHHREFLPDHPTLNSIYFGGGTPSLLSASDICTIMDAASESFKISEDAEITLEANPNDVISNDICRWREAGVNRLSIGLQSINGQSLKFLGRDHSAKSGLEAVETALHVFQSVSADLIYALPNQSLESWEQELKQVLTFDLDHLSLYELTFEERTAFGRRLNRGEIIQPSEDLRADFYQLTIEVTKRAGMQSYEISNHAKNENSRSVHNTIYWRGGDWIGVGPGAHGRITRGTKRYATQMESKPTDYMRAVESRNGMLDNLVELDAREISNELILMGLRLKEGIEIERLKRLGHIIDRDSLEMFIEEVLVKITSGKVHLTEKGFPLADGIGAKLAS